MNAKEQRQFCNAFEEIRQRAQDLEHELSSDDYNRDIDREYLRILLSLDSILSECESIQIFLNR